jgi:hypothetical protein
MKLGASSTALLIAIAAAITAVAFASATLIVVRMGTVVMRGWARIVALLVTRL